MSHVWNKCHVDEIIVKEQWLWNIHYYDKRDIIVERVMSFILHIVVEGMILIIICGSFDIIFYYKIVIIDGKMSLFDFKVSTFEAINIIFCGQSCVPTSLGKIVIGAR